MEKQKQKEFRSSNPETQRLRKAYEIRKGLHMIIRMIFQIWKLRAMKQQWRLKEVYGDNFFES